MTTAFDDTTTLQHKLILSILGTLVCMVLMIRTVLQMERDGSHHVTQRSRSRRKQKKRHDHKNNNKNKNKNHSKRKSRVEKLIEHNLSELTLSIHNSHSSSSSTAFDRPYDDDDQEDPKKRFTNINNGTMQNYNAQEQTLQFPTQFPPGLSDDVNVTLVSRRSESFDDDESVVSYTSMQEDTGWSSTAAAAADSMSYDPRTRRRLDFMDKMGILVYIILLTFLNYLLMVYLPAGMILSVSAMLFTTLVVLKSPLSDEIRRKRWDRMMRLVTLMFFMASFLSLARFAMIGFQEGEIYEGPARIVGYNQERYGDNSLTRKDGNQIRMDLVVQFGGAWACPGNSNQQCQAQVSGALCQQKEEEDETQARSDFVFLDGQDSGHGRKSLEWIRTLQNSTKDTNTSTTVEDKKEEDKEYTLMVEQEDSNSNGSEDVIIVEEEVAVMESDEAAVDESIEEEEDATVESVEKEKNHVEDQLSDESDKEAVEGAFDTEEVVIENEYSEYESELNHEFDETIDSLGGVDSESLQQEDSEQEIETLKDKVNYYAEKSQEEEKTIQQEDKENTELWKDYNVQYYTKLDLENELVKQEVKAENMTKSEAYMDVMNKTSVYEKEENSYVNSYYSDDKFQGEDDETYKDEAYYAIENFFFDDDFFEDEYWNYEWDSVWGDYACTDLFDNDLEGKSFDAEETPGADDWPFINIYGTCNSCKAFLVDYYTQEHFDEIKKYQTNAIHYCAIALVSSLAYCVLAIKQWISPAEDYQITLLAELA